MFEEDFMKYVLSTLPKLVNNKKKRLGRGLGSGKGAKSARGGTRHQSAREDIPLSFEGGQGRMIKRFPLLRGKGRNKPASFKNKPLSIERLNVFDDNATVDMNSLIEKKLVLPRYHDFGVKILANGVLKKKLIVALPVSQSAKKMIEDAGGQVKSV
jgi:large subunit ribosomal protein L15